MPTRDHIPSVRKEDVKSYEYAKSHKRNTYLSIGCVHLHTPCYRYVSNGQCVDCAYEAYRRYKLRERARLESYGIEVATRDPYRIIDTTSRGRRRPPSPAQTLGDGWRTLLLPVPRRHRQAVWEFAAALALMRRRRLRPPSHMLTAPPPMPVPCHRDDADAIHKYYRSL